MFVTVGPVMRGGHFTERSRVLLLVGTREPKRRRGMMPERVASIREEAARELRDNNYTPSSRWLTEVVELCDVVELCSAR